MKRAEQVRHAIELIGPRSTSRAECRSDIEDALNVLAIERINYSSGRGSKDKAKAANQFIGHIEKARRLLPMIYPGYPVAQEQFDKSVAGFKEQAEAFVDAKPASVPSTFIQRQAALAAGQLLSKFRRDGFTKIEVAKLAAILFGRDPNSAAAFLRYIPKRKKSGRK